MYYIIEHQPSIAENISRTGPLPTPVRGVEFGILPTDMVLRVKPITAKTKPPEMLHVDIQ
jgi:hypothetical protein